MTCRAGCPTKDHRSYAACLQSANVKIAATINSRLQMMYETTKGDLSAYESARRHGIQPGGTSLEKVRQAEEATRLLGRAYNAEKDPPADMIVNKNTARFVNAED